MDRTYQPQKVEEKIYKFWPHIALTCSRGLRPRVARACMRGKEKGDYGKNLQT